jgi:uncharacterized protein (UPF0332 family)
MFDPKDLLKLSENILEIISNECGCSKELTNNCCKEAIYRTIVNRAYYAVYLSCSDFLRKNFGIDVYSEAKKHEISVHAMLPQIISKKLNKHYLQDWINDLRYSRRNSDYDLDITIGKDDSEKSIHLAKAILKDLGII